ncbi:MAG: (Fe-S)-binding protein [Lachnospiraceae bacterium]
MAERVLLVLYNRKEEYCGCTACYAICLKFVVLMAKDGEGFAHFRIDESKCIWCYSCIKV